MNLKLLKEEFDRFLKDFGAADSSDMGMEEIIDLDGTKPDGLTGRGKILAEVISNELKKYLVGTPKIVKQYQDTEAISFNMKVKDQNYEGTVFLHNIGLTMRFLNKTINKGTEISSAELRKDTKIGYPRDGEINNELMCQNFKVKTFSEIPKDSIMAEFAADLGACFKLASDKYKLIM